MGKNGKPKMYDVETLIAAGINPITGAPLKLDKCCASSLKVGIRQFLRIIDEQDACNRFEWTIPKGLKLTSLEIERLLYYKGQIMFFAVTDPITQKTTYYLLPYALDGDIDQYGRYLRVRPVPMTSGDDEDKGKVNKYQMISALRLFPQYEVPDTIDEVDKMQMCVLLHDYTKQLAQTITPRQIVNEPLLDVMSDCIPYMKTAMIMGSGVKAVRVPDQDSSDQVEAGSKSLDAHAKAGRPLVPMTSDLEFQEITNGSTGTKVNEYMLAMQSLDNLRLQGYGIQNGGLFEKKAHMLDKEAGVNDTCSSIIMEDALKIRQHFCDVVNAIWNVGIAVKQKKTEEGMNVAETNDQQEGGDKHGQSDVI